MRAVGISRHVTRQTLHSTVAILVHVPRHYFALIKGVSHNWYRFDTQSPVSSLNCDVLRFVEGLTSPTIFLLSGSHTGSLLASTDAQLFTSLFPYLQVQASRRRPLAAPIEDRPTTRLRSEGLSTNADPVSANVTRRLRRARATRSRASVAESAVPCPTCGDLFRNNRALRVHQVRGASICVAAATPLPGTALYSVQMHGESTLCEQASGLHTPPITLLPMPSNLDPQSTPPTPPADVPTCALCVLSCADDESPPCSTHYMSCNVHALCFSCYDSMVQASSTAIAHSYSNESSFSFTYSLPHPLNSCPFCRAG